MYNFQFKEFEVTHIIKPKLKHSYLSIDKQFHIVVKTPKVSQDFVKNLLLEKEAWLRKQYKILLENQAQKVNLQDEVLLFGEVLSVDIESALYLQKKLSKCKTNNKDEILKIYDSFYKNVAKEYLPQRILYFSSLMQLPFQEIKYRKMKRRWGSCSSSKILTFNTQLMKVSKELIDYVIVHEIAHLKHMNHSKAFHALVEQYLPNSKQRRETLKNIQLTF